MLDEDVISFSFRDIFTFSLGSGCKIHCENCLLSGYDISYFILALQFWCQRTPFETSQFN